MQEEIPLHDYNAPALPSPFDLQVKEAAKEDISPWLKAYRDLMGTSVDQFHVLIGQKRQFDLIDAAGGLYVRKSEHGFYTFRIDRVISNVRPERLMHVIKDYALETRIKWDYDNVSFVSQRETYADDNIHYVECTVKSQQNPRMVWDRHVMGICWTEYNPRTATYTHVLRTTQHRLWRCPATAVNVIGLMGVKIRILEDDKIEFIMIANFNPGNSLPSFLVDPRAMMRRVDLYVSVARDFDQYYTK